MTQTTLYIETQRPTLPEYFERFVQHVWPNKPQHWQALTWELIEAGSDGRGNEYTLETAQNLVVSREAGKQPEELGYFGSWEPPHGRIA